MADPEKPAYDEARIRELNPVFVMDAFAAYVNAVTDIGESSVSPVSKAIIHRVAKVGQQQWGYPKSSKAHVRGFMKAALSDVDLRVRLFASLTANQDN